MDSVIYKILNLARWAPSGDNTQPWRFEIRTDRQVIVHGFDTRSHCVYDLEGRGSQISLGALLETMTLAATAHGLRTDIVRRVDTPDTAPTFIVSFSADPCITTSPLVPFITQRSVQRRPMSMRPLKEFEKTALEAAIGSEFSVIWFEGFIKRFSVASILFRNAKLRLTIPEAYEVHRSIIEWNAEFSDDRIPDSALGADRATLRLMRWAMHSWKRVNFLNRFLAGTWAPRVSLDLLPGLACAAHLVIQAARPPVTIDDYVAVGRAVQRLWLTTTQLGLLHQPEMTPLIFSSYSRQNIRFSGTSHAAPAAARLRTQLDDLLENNSSCAVWMGRVGFGRPATSRSTRIPLDKLLFTGQILDVIHNP